VTWGWDVGSEAERKPECDGRLKKILSKSSDFHC
jgi:hypothetical protein